ncbi:MAG: hypothetical protein JO107_12180 [Hyphomicrobiales bacterium]|nr:hypothetical protein [Hyphomicrobiales bacterium]MBV8663853.1 hypothetical protein [Hyphomicrobiales bacterium]
MSLKSSFLLAVFCTMCLALFSAPANAQATRTWVSGVGDDANPCSRTAPCQTFASAISKTLAGGEIDCLDSGGFGAVTITKAITILCVTGVSNGGVLASQSDGIVVAAGATDRVVLDGLDIEGLSPGPNPGLNGVKIVSGAAVYIRNCEIRDFGQNGVNVVSSTAGTRVFIEDSFIENNGASATTYGGVNVQGNGAANSAAIADTLIDGNANFAVQTGGAGNTIALVRTILSGTSNNVAISDLGGGVNSIGPSNVIIGAGAPTVSPTFK